MFCSYEKSRFNSDCDLEDEVMNITLDRSLLSKQPVFHDLISGRRDIISRIIVLSSFLLISACDKQPVTPDYDPIFVPTIPPSVSYIDIFPTQRPGMNEIAYVRRLKNAHPDSVTEGLYLVYLDGDQVSLLSGGKMGRPTWLNKDTIIFPSYSDPSRSLTLLNIVEGTNIPLSSVTALNPNASRLDSLIVFDDGNSISILDISTGNVTPIYEEFSRTPTFSIDVSSIFISRGVQNGFSYVISSINLSGQIISDLNSPREYYYSSYPSLNESGTILTYQICHPDQNNKVTYSIVLKDLSISDSTLYITNGLYPSFVGDSGMVYSWYKSDHQYEYRVFYKDLKNGEVKQITY